MLMALVPPTYRSPPVRVVFVVVPPKVIEPPLLLKLDCKITIPAPSRLGDVEAVEALVLLSASKTMFNAPAVEVMAWLMTMELAALNAKFTPEVPVDFVMAESMVMLPKLPEPEKVVIVTLVPALSRPLMEPVEMVDRPSLLPLMLVPLAVIKTSVGSNNHSPARPLTDMADPETPSVISV